MAAAVLAGAVLAALVADGKVYVGTENGLPLVFAAGRVKNLLSTVVVRAAVHASPVAANGVLYITTARYLFAVKWMVQCPARPGRIGH